MNEQAASNPYRQKNKRKALVSRARGGRGHLVERIAGETTEEQEREVKSRSSTGNVGEGE
jgi:hypothetical protein